MYFVISVLPISMTSGELPPASVASNFCRWSGQLWYWTLTLTPGWSFWNCWVAAATTSGQPDCASTWSHTVMPDAWWRELVALAEAAAIPSTTVMAAATTTLNLIGGLP